MSHVYPTLDEILAIHQDQIERFGGTPGILNKGALDSALMRPQQGYYNNLIEETAALLESLVTNHAFVDGNKRVAFFGTDAFLRINGHCIDCDSDEANRFIRSILADKSNRLERIQAWLREHIKTLPKNE